jgi:hypothetical protein
MAQWVSALRSGRRGRQFESGYSDVDMTNWWSWVVFFNGGFALWLAFRFKRWGPLYSILGQIGWFVYGLTTRQYGFIPASIMNMIIFGWASRRGFKAKRQETERGEPNVH